jgi:hypothetical protein
MSLTILPTDRSVVGMLSTYSSVVNPISTGVSLPGGYPAPNWAVLWPVPVDSTVYEIGSGLRI